MPRSIRACRTVGNARKGPSSVRWVTFAIIAAHISRADNVWRNDRQRFARQRNTATTEAGNLSGLFAEPNRPLW
jgi:hypothetical protein